MLESTVTVRDFAELRDFIRPRDFIKHPLVVSVVSIALGASLTWYANRPARARLTYTTSVISTGTNPNTRAVVPDLRLQLGNEVIPVIHTHVLELTARDYRAEDATISITFVTQARIFGIGTEAPSPLHTATCMDLKGHIRCALSPLDPRFDTAFRVLVATDMDTMPKIDLADGDVDLTTLDAYLREGLTFNKVAIALNVASFGFIIFMLFSSFLRNRRRSGQR